MMINMELRLEWEGRIEKWMRVLTQDLYKPLEEIELEGFETMEQLSLEEAMKGSFHPVRPGDVWGREWEYMWLRGQVVLPEAAEGKRIVMRLDLGGEASLFVNGQPFGTRRAEWVREPHHYFSDQTLTDNAKPGERFDLAFEAYAGHFFPGCDYGPILPGTFPNPDPQEKRAHLGHSSIGVWNEEAYQLFMDVKVLWELMRSIDNASLRWQQLWEGLKDFTRIVDFEQTEEKRNESYRAARARLAPLLACKNGSTAPQFYAFGHAHIDIAWLWPLAETERKILRTFAAQIRHMDEYPSYKFFQSQPHLYQMVKDLYPSLYERIKEKVAAGQWIADGGMWVEADTNITGGESLIRQFVHGKRFFREEFGVDSRFLWLPDVFGYSAALPQIMKGCGIDSFSTQKIWWCYNGGQMFPYNFFWWEGMDGTRIPSFMHNDYTATSHPGVILDKWNNRPQKTGYSSFLLPFGYGDGGGGPARDYIEQVLREGDLEGCPRVKIAGPDDFFAENAVPDETYVGELYVQCHRGVQTSQAKTKKGNRKSELALREAEIWGAAASRQGYAFPLEVMDAAWKKVLLCQFHDILPGSSINRVYKEAEAAYADVLQDAAAVCADAMDTLCGQKDGATVFNSLSWERTGLVRLPAGFHGAALNGEILPVQQEADGLYAQVTVPSMGYVTLQDAAPETAPAGASGHLEADGAVLENEFVRARFGRKGELLSFVDKATGQERTQGICNDLRMYQSIPRAYEAWDIDQAYESCPVTLSEEAQLEVVSAGPLKATLKVTRRLNESDLCQYIHLEKNSRRIDFETEIEWRETHKLLKVNFPVSVYTEEALHEIQFGHVKRPTHRNQQFDFDRFETSNHKWTALAESGRGAAVLNDCKYGVSVQGNSINLTLLHASMCPDPEADKGLQKFTYSFLAWDGPFMDSDVVRQGYDLNCPLMMRPGAAGTASLLQVDAPNVVVEALKPAEDGSGDWIIRLYEAKKTHTRAKLHLSAACECVEETDMLEENGKAMEWMKEGKGVTVPLTFHPFEIKTLRVKF